MSWFGAARWLVVAGGFVAVIAAAALVARPSAQGRITEESVEAGFARDMSVHHAQAVQMASYAREYAPTAEIRRLASTIVNQQQLEIGQMLGWLEAWGLPRASVDPAMAWMAPDEAPHAGHGSHRSSAMPGMATPAEMDALLNLDGKRLEVRFLQLMIRHHQGGVPMARFAAEHADRRHVRDIAGLMAVSQAEEIDLMGHLLSQRDGEQLPAP